MTSQKNNKHGTPYLIIPKEAILRLIERFNDTTLYLPRGYEEEHAKAFLEGVIGVSIRVVDGFSWVDSLEGTLEGTLDDTPTENPAWHTDPAFVDEYTLEHYDKDTMTSLGDLVKDTKRKSVIGTEEQ